MARYSHAPKLVHWKAALHVLLYVRFTSGYGITFQRGTAIGVGCEVYVDSDYGSRATDRKSVSGGVVMCAGGCVSFFSRTQKSVTLSSTEAENVAMAEGLKEAIFLRYIWIFIFPDGDVGCTTVHEDNVGALHLANNPATKPNSKHIDIRHHFIRERVANGGFGVVHVRSDLQHADFLTKPLHRGVLRPPQFRDEYFLIFFFTAVILLAKIMRGGYDVIICGHVCVFLFLWRNSCLFFYCSCFSALRDTCWFSGEAAFSLF